MKKIDVFQEFLSTSGVEVKTEFLDNAEDMKKFNDFVERVQLEHNYKSWESEKSVADLRLRTV